MRRALVVFTIVTAACGKTLPTSPLAACPPIPANFVETDTTYAVPASYSGPDATFPRPILWLIDVYACGADTALFTRVQRTP